MKLLSTILTLLSLCYLLTAQAQDQDEPSRPSPFAQASLRFKDTYVKITYSQPAKNGREVFGKLVPYGKVWRTGANEATEITITKNITLNGFLLKAGTYTVFTIPGQKAWTIIINSEVGLWGAYNHNPKLDILKFQAPVTSTPDIHERFTIQLLELADAATLLLLWDNVKVVIPIKFL